MKFAAWIVLAVLLTAILLVCGLCVSGCGAPGERPYCAVCDATGICKYEPFEREAAAEKKATFWGGGSLRTIGPINPPPPVPPVPPMR